MVRAAAPALGPSGPGPTGYAVQYKPTDAASRTAPPHAGVVPQTSIGGTAYAAQVRALRGAVPGVWTAGRGATARVPQVSLKTGVTVGLRGRVNGSPRRMRVPNAGGR